MYIFQIPGGNMSWLQRSKHLKIEKGAHMNVYRGNNDRKHVELYRGWDVRISQFRPRNNMGFIGRLSPFS